MSLLPYILDILCVLIIVSCVIYYARKGFLSAVFGFVVLFVALGLALVASRKLAEPVFENVFRPSLVTRTTEVAAESGAETVSDLTDKLLAVLPDFLKDQVAGLIQVSEADVANYSAGFAENLVDNVFAPIIIPVIVFVIFIVLFLVLWFVASRISKVLTRARNIPVIGTANAVLGAVVGVLIGVVYCFLLMLIIKGAEALSPPQTATGSYFAHSFAYGLFNRLPFFT